MRTCLWPLALVIAGAAAGPAGAATPMVVTATTWLHAGPDRESLVLGEVGTGVAVSVLGCSGGWCAVEFDQALGYVQATLLAAARASRPTAWRPGPDCIAAQHFTAEGPLRLTICPDPAPGR